METGRQRSAKEKLIEYFLEHGYGQDYYPPEDLQEIFKEMDAVGLLFPSNDSNRIDVYADWREKHDRYWFKKWFNRYRRVRTN